MELIETFASIKKAMRGSILILPFLDTNECFFTVKEVENWLVASLPQVLPIMAIKILLFLLKFFKFYIICGYERMIRIWFNV